MKKLILLAITFLMSSTLGYAATQSTMVCTMQGMKDKLSFTLPDKIGNMPKVDFPYPIDVAIFHHTSDTMLLVAVDHNERYRPRLFISVQAAKNDPVYHGRFMTDFGGNELQVDSGSIDCKVSP